MKKDNKKETTKSVNKGRSGYKHTALGWIPEEWEVKHLKDCIDPKRNATYGIVQPGTYTQAGIKMVRSQDYATGWYDKESIMSVSARIEEPYKRSRIKEDDILITLVGANLGKLAMVPPWLNQANISRAVGRIAINKNATSPQFIFYQLHSGLIDKLIKLSTIGGAQPVLNLSELSILRIFVPPLTEQHQIANILSTWDLAIAKIEQLIGQLKIRNKGLMEKLLTGKKRLKGYEKSKWQVKRIDEVASVNLQSLSPKTDPAFSFLYIDLSCVNEGKVSFPREKIQLSFASPRARRIFQKGDVLMATVRPNLKGFCYVDFDASKMICSTGFAVIHARSEVAGKFIYYSLLSRGVEAQINQLITGSNYPAINSSDVQGLTLHFPETPEELHKIVNILEITSLQVERFEQILYKIQQQKKGLMQNLLTGQIRANNKI